MMNCLKIIGAACSLALAGTSHAGLLAHYSFDSDFTDNSGNANNATDVDNGVDNSGITNTAGAYVFGGGAYFNAEQGDYVDIPDQVFANGESWSISAWSRRTSNDGHGMIIGDRSNSTDFLWHTSNFSGLRLRNSGNVTKDLTVVKDTEWHHWAVVADGTSSQATVYVDGVQIGPSFGYSTGFRFREIADAYSGLSLAFVGEIDEVYIFDEAIDSTTVTSLFTSNAVPEPGSLALLALGGLMIARRRR